MTVTRTVKPMFVVRTFSGSPPPMIWLREADSQSYKIGEFVYQVAGYGTVVADSGAVMLGMALAVGTSVTSGHAWHPIIVATDDVIFCSNIHHDTAASALMAADEVGDKKGLYVSSNIHQFDLSDNDDILCGVGWYWEDNDDATIVNARVEFIVLPAGQQFGAGGD